LPVVQLIMVGAREKKNEKKTENSHPFEKRGGERGTYAVIAVKNRVTEGELDDVRHGHRTLTFGEAETARTKKSAARAGNKKKLSLCVQNNGLVVGLADLGGGGWSSLAGSPSS